jgi:cell fate regulator YaaT (PSP1 superfamily)
MERLVNVRLRDTGQNFVYNAHDLDVKENDYVIVEHDRGLDYGQIMSLRGETEQPVRLPPQPAQPVKRIVRIARDTDLKQIEDNRARSKEAFATCQKKIAEHKLEMKLVQAEYSFDRSKIIFYFTSGGRVDFRNLVKDLAKIFKARIELRQIGVRDETKFFGGYGPCGRQLCCATFLKDFEPVTIKMAKEEGLPLNPPKISGICGRLMCCLNYEYETYKILSKGLPREGERITTAEGKGKVLNVNVFKRAATVELEEGKIIEVSYKEKCEGSCAQECPMREKIEQPEIKPERPERVEQRPARPDYRQDRRERGGRPPVQDVRPGRGQQTPPARPLGQPPSQGEAMGRPRGQSPGQGERPGRPYGQDRGGNRSNQQRNDRSDRGRQERRHDQRRPWQPRPGQPPAQEDRPERPSGQPQK